MNEAEPRRLEGDLLGIAAPEPNPSTDLEFI
jgi:hypothetical protein